MSGDFVPGRPDRDEPEPTIDARVPDAIEPITAYRVWRTDSYGRLRSFNHHGAWVPSRWTVARCARDGGAAPLEGCTCGLYAAKELEDVLALAETLGETTAVVGRVELAGKVIEHDHGYRAELARVRDILPIEGQRARIEHIARRFGVPIGYRRPRSGPCAREGRPRPSASTGRSTRTAPRPRSSGTPKAAESLPWLILAIAHITLNNLAAGIDRYHWSDWRLLAALVGTIIAIGVWIFVRLWMGRRFSRQLRSFVSGPANRPP
jgi:hypothetical protein